jgi:hypothetical protein
MWKAGHNFDVKDAAQEKNKLKRSSYKTSQSDGVQVYDMFRRKRGRQSQEQLRELFEKNMSNQCRQCGKFYTRNGRHNACSGVWKEHSVASQGEAGMQNGSQRQDALKIAFEEGDAQQCSRCHLYYKRSHKQCRKLDSQDVVSQNVQDGEREKDENVADEGAGDAAGEVVEENEEELDEEDDNASSENIDENVNANVFDEQDLLVRNLVVPSDEDIEQLQLDESEIKSLEKQIWVEAPFFLALRPCCRKRLGMRIWRPGESLLLSLGRRCCSNFRVPMRRR